MYRTALRTASRPAASSIRSCAVRAAPRRFASSSSSAPNANLKLGDSDSEYELELAKDKLKARANEEPMRDARGDMKMKLN